MRLELRADCLAGVWGHTARADVRDRAGSFAILVAGPVCKTFVRPLAGPASPWRRTIYERPESLDQPKNWKAAQHGENTT